MTFIPRIVHGYRSFAQAYQDLFVAAMLGGKRAGTYLVLGAGHPFAESNTALLELDYGWTGLSWELDPGLHEEFVAGRANRCLNENALSFDFSSFLPTFFTEPVIDYLSVDIDENLPLLEALPFDKYRFAVITFEHDHYRLGPHAMLASREFFSGLGYSRVVSNVHTQGRDFEDWWVDADLVEEEKISRFSASGEEAIDLFGPDTLTPRG
jgi:hypothetical protein